MTQNRSEISQANADSGLRHDHVPLLDVGGNGCDPADNSCHLCSDEALRGRVLAVDPQTRTASVLLGDAVATVALDLIDASVGDEVLVHLGFAIQRLEHG